MAKELERRFYTFEPNAEKRDDGTAQISGRPIVYNSPTDIGGMFREIIMPGALDGADLKDIPLLVNHNSDMIPVARSRRNNGNSTMQLFTDTDGMGFTASLDVARNATAAELYSAVERKDISGMSFAFRVDEERWEGLETDYPTRYINRFSNIREISAVTFPAYDATEINARSKSTLESARAALESATQSRANAVDTADEIELLKAKALFKSKI
jgi:HK97 family phage prohead protease